MTRILECQGYDCDIRVFDSGEDDPPARTCGKCGSAMSVHAVPKTREDGGITWVRGGSRPVPRSVTLGGVSHPLQPPVITLEPRVLALEAEVAYLRSMVDNLIVPGLKRNTHELV